MSALRGNTQPHLQEVCPAQGRRGQLGGGPLACGWSAVRGDGGQSPGSRLPGSPWVELLSAWIDHDAWAWACLLKDKAPRSQGFLLHVTEAGKAGGTVKCQPRQPEYDPSGARIPSRRLIHQNVSYSRYAAISLMLISSTERISILPFSGYWGAGRSAVHPNSAGCLIYRAYLQAAAALSLLGNGPSATEGLVPASQLRAFCPFPSPCDVGTPGTVGLYMAVESLLRQPNRTQHV